ncbi:hypothetical protein ACFV97_18650 [Streptomyces sp. NPDC059913]|uniref:hypothetical protein n=1 Tax=unclassified Streptomyces TaxID=2593676 RepID=UPI0036478365
MPRGRHRHSPPLHRILPPSAVAGVSVVCAAGSWLLAEPLVLRGLVAVTAVAAVTGAYLMRSWDRDAGRRVAELARARAGDEWRAEERAAELESDLEEARELRARLETKLRRKRVELANLRGEHAALLRRYANAETGRASALEGRRQLALEAAAPREPAAKAPRELAAATSTPTPGAYLRAAQALRDLSRNAALQEARRAAEQARRTEVARRPAAAPAPAAPPAAEEDRTAARHLRPPAPLPPARQSVALPPARPASPASAVAPYAPARRQPVPQGSFDFFGTQTQKNRAAIESVQDEDLADVVGEEALAAHRTDRAAKGAVGKVIDLTAHDETEQLDVVELRSAIS